MRDLTRRELQILRLASEGYLTKEIAKKLNTATATVKAHRQNILRKLDAVTMAQAVAIACDEGFL